MDNPTATIDSRSDKQATERNWAIGKRAAKAQPPQREPYHVVHERVSDKLIEAGCDRRTATSAATAVARLSQGDRLSPGDVQALNDAIQAKGGSNGKP